MINPSKNKVIIFLLKNSIYTLLSICLGYTCLLIISYWSVGKFGDIRNFYIYVIIVLCADFYYSYRRVNFSLSYLFYESYFIIKNKKFNDKVIYYNDIKSLRVVKGSVIKLDMGGEKSVSLYILSEEVIEQLLKSELSSVVNKISSG